MGRFLFKSGPNFISKVVPVYLVRVHPREFRIETPFPLIPV